MNRYVVYGWLALVSLLAVSCAADAGGDAAATAVGLQAAAQDTEPSNDQAVQVHGRWRLDVRNADGSMDQVVEFENALTGGKPDLVSLLGREATVGLWALELESLNFDYDSFGMIHPCGSPEAPKMCWINEPESAFSGEEVFSNLTVDTSSGTSLVLSGQATMSNETTIDGVGSFLELCEATVTPADCIVDGGVTGSFTYRNNFESASDFESVPVSPGQVVTVTVTLSFE